jgi:phosphoglycolate phosphatase
MAHYKHIIWDWNGTLIDDTWLCIDIINSLLEKYKKPTITLNEYHKVFDFPVKNYYQQVGFNFEETPFEIVGAEFMQMYWARWKECNLHQNAEQVLKLFANLGISQSILSAAGIELLQVCTTHFKLGEYFEQLSGLDHQYATGKIDLAKQFIKNTSISPNHIVLIGDTTHDFEVSQEIDIDCILFNGGHHPTNKLQTCGVDIVTNLLDLKNFISSK